MLSALYFSRELCHPNPSRRIFLSLSRTEGIATLLQSRETPFANHRSLRRRRFGLSRLGRTQSPGGTRSFRHRDLCELLHLRSRPTHFFPSTVLHSPPIRRNPRNGERLLPLQRGRPLLLLQRRTIP